MGALTSGPSGHRGGDGRADTRQTSSRSANRDQPQSAQAPLAMGQPSPCRWNSGLGQDLVKRARAGVACPLGVSNPLCHDATLPLRVTEKEGRSGRRRFPLRYGPALSGPSEDETSRRAFSPLAESLVDATVLAAARACACMMKKRDEGEKEEGTFGQCSPSVRQSVSE